MPPSRHPQSSSHTPPAPRPNQTTRSLVGSITDLQSESQSSQGLKDKARGQIKSKQNSEQRSLWAGKRMLQRGMQGADELLVNTVSPGRGPCPRWAHRRCSIQTRVKARTDHQLTLYLRSNRELGKRSVITPIRCFEGIKNLRHRIGPLSCRLPGHFCILPIFAPPHC